MSRPIPDHGTGARYKGRRDLPGCRCGACTTAASRADAERRLDRLSGTPRAATPAVLAKVLKHLRQLASSDMSHAEIAKASGTSQSTVSQLLSGQRKALMSSTATKLLRVRPTDRSATCMVSAVGAMRRLRALYWMGHGARVISSRTGLQSDTVMLLARGMRARTTAARFDAVRRVYDDLAMVPGLAEQPRAFAVERGWLGPLAWDDDTIDDPRAEPMVDAVAPVATEGENVAARWLMGESVVLSPDDKHEVLLHLFEWSTFSPGQIAARLEMSESAAEQTWFRHKKKLRNAGQPVPWRRRWDVRVKDLTKNQMNEMGAAA